jgi:hypothetical protein
LGKQERRITLHNLGRVKEIVRRFSSPDNYWCFVFERIVSSYVSTPTNWRNIEHTLSDKQAQREFLKLNGSDKNIHISLPELWDSKAWKAVLLFL